MSSDSLDVTHGQYETLSFQTMTKLFNDESFTDISLISDDGGSVKAHKAVLAANSLVLHNLINEAQLDNKDVVIYLKDIPSTTLRYWKNFFTLDK